MGLRHAAEASIGPRKVAVRNEEIVDALFRRATLRALEPKARINLLLPIGRLTCALERLVFTYILWLTPLIGGARPQPLVHGGLAIEGFAATLSFKLLLQGALALGVELVNISSSGGFSSAPTRLVSTQDRITDTRYRR
jgi:hypothetical protein